MLFNWAKRRNKNSIKTIEEYLISDEYELHDDNDGSQVFVKNLEVIRIVKQQINDKEKHTLSLYINGLFLFEISFKPSLSMFMHLLKKSIIDYDESNV